MPRVLIVAETTGYQTRAFEEAARACGVELVYATNHCDGLDDPWRDGAVSVHFDEPEAAVAAVRALAAARPLDGVLAVGDRPAELAAWIAEGLGLPFHPPGAAGVARSKVLTRGRLLAGGLPVPWFFTMPREAGLDAVADRLRFPCVVKPLALSASRGVMRANDPREFEAAASRLRRLLDAPDIRVLDDPAHDEILVEGFVEGREFALEGLLDHGLLRVLAIFDKPDPLDGPTFEETIYVTPPPLAFDAQRLIAATIAHAAAAIGLTHGPIHAECRVNTRGVFVLEVAARPIGGLCARALRFARGDRTGVPLEELLLRFAAGESMEGYGREAAASGVMMLPVPGLGRFRAVRGVDEARAVVGITDLVITARPGQLIEPLPEGHSYPGFVFARGESADAVVAALREAHAALRFELDRVIALDRWPDDPARDA